MTETKKAGYAYLRPITGVEAITIPALPGTRTISNDGGSIFGWIDEDFVNWDANTPGGPTEAFTGVMHELVRDATFETFYADTPEFWFTQDQMLYICEHHKDKLPDGTFLRFKSEGADGVERTFGAYVFFDDDNSLQVNVHSFSNDDKWDAVGDHGVLLPAT